MVNVKKTQEKSKGKKRKNVRKKDEIKVVCNPSTQKQSSLISWPIYFSILYESKYVLKIFFSPQNWHILELFSFTLYIMSSFPRY